MRLEDTKQDIIMFLRNNKTKKLLNLMQTRFPEVLMIDTIMNSSQDIIYFKDKDSYILLSSRAHSQLLGFEDPSDTIGKRDVDFFSKEFARKTRNDERQIMITGIPLTGIVEKWEMKDNVTKWFSTSKYPFYNEKGKLIGTWGTSEDITELKMTEEELARVNQELEMANTQLIKLSNTDGLSGLYNQRYFCEVLEKTFEEYRKNYKGDVGDTFCVLLIDIDCFKSINDRFGHLVGDMAIKHIADLLLANIRTKDICFRYGGDEFGVILFDTEITLGKKIAKRICKTIEKSNFMEGDIRHKLTVSIGISNFKGEDNFNSVIQSADSNLYEAKRQGKNRIYYNEELGT